MIEIISVKRTGETDVNGWIVNGNIGVPNNIKNKYCRQVLKYIYDGGEVEIDYKEIYLNKLKTIRANFYTVCYWDKDTEKISQRDPSELLPCFPINSVSKENLVQKLSYVLGLPSPSEADLSYGLEDDKVYDFENKAELQSFSDALTEYCIVFEFVFRKAKKYMIYDATDELELEAKYDEVFAEYGV